MAEYIERKKAIEAAKHAWAKGLEPLQYIEIIPAADVAPVRHGRWETVKNPQWPAYEHDKCNICGWWNTRNALCYDGNHKPGHSLNYCPNCGARMDEGDEQHGGK